MTSILFDAQSNNWSDNKSFYEVSNSLFSSEFFRHFASCFCHIVQNLQMMMKLDVLGAIEEYLLE